MNARLAEDIRAGRVLAPDETLLWSGAPSWRRVARDALHLRGVSAYFGLLFVLDAYQAWKKAIPFGQAVLDSVPLAVITGLALGILAAVAWLVGRSRYTITDRRVILRYGIALPVTLSIPMSQIMRTAAAVNADGTADVALVLKSGSRIPYLKLWPHARPWQITHPQPMLRSILGGEAAAATLSGALRLAELGRSARGRQRLAPTQVPMRLSA